MPWSERVTKYFLSVQKKKKKKKATIPPRSGWDQKVIFVGIKMSGPPRPFFFFFFFFFVRLKSSSAQLPNCNGFPSRLLIQRTPLVDWLSILALDSISSTRSVWKQVDHHTSALDGGKIKSVHIKSIRFSVPVSNGDDFTRWPSTRKWINTSLLWTG